MVRDQTTDEERARENHTVNRRNYLKGVSTAAAAATVGVGSLTAATGTAAAVSRSSYTIRTDTAEETTVYVIDADEAGPTVMVVGGMHGDEEAGYMTANKIKDWSIDRGKLVVLPEANKKAINNNSRNANLAGNDDGVVDLNDQFPEGSSPDGYLPEAIWGVVTDENIDFLWDMHSARGRYKNGSGSSVGQALFSTVAGDAERHRYHLQSYLNDNYVQNSENDFTGATSGSVKPMLKHKVGADLNTPAMIFETYEDLNLDRQIMWGTTVFQEFLQDEGLLDENLSYDGDGHAKNTPQDSNDKNSGLQFGVSNEYGQNVSITDLEIRPVNGASDQLRDHTLEEGKWKSELFIDADVQNGLTDVNNGLSLPGTIDLDADGHSDSADKEAILSSGSSSKVSLYQFKLNGSPTNMGAEECEFTLHYEMADGTRGFDTFTVSGFHRLEYTGDAKPINAPEDSNNHSSGVHFSVGNNTHSEMTIEEMTIDPANSNIDQLRDHTYQESKWNSELVIEADVQNGLTDVNNGLSLPGTIDLDADGHSDSADKNAVLSSGTTADVFLYQFKAGGSPIDLVGEDIDITIDYSLASGSSGSETFTLSL
ncbi:M14 family metallopeptidase [Halorussus halophilus]|uniref:succinylglutamate desuccinylase/aspartoacylase family protein n=1 Tax=Halorussus halophilus TaxID=2650975 RepID=UPI001300F7DD|nr:succinylglutamate desuccinylase/aspartoacylase family protein [Halorussus halophilus]